MSDISTPFLEASTVKVTDSLGQVQTSSAITIKVNGLPSIAIVNPSNNASFIAPANIALSATAAAASASDTIAKVEYFQGSTLIGTATEERGQVLNYGDEERGQVLNYGDEH